MTNKPFSCRQSTQARRLFCPVKARRYQPTRNASGFWAGSASKSASTTSCFMSTPTTHTCLKKSAGQTRPLLQQLRVFLEPRHLQEVCSSPLPAHPSLLLSLTHTLYLSLARSLSPCLSLSHFHLIIPRYPETSGGGRPQPSAVRPPQSPHSLPSADCSPPPTIRRPRADTLPRPLSLPTSLSGPPPPSRTCPPAPRFPTCLCPSSRPAPAPFLGPCRSLSRALSLAHALSPPPSPSAASARLRKACSRSPPPPRSPSPNNIPLDPLSLPLHLSNIPLLALSRSGQESSSPPLRLRWPPPLPPNLRCQPEVKAVPVDAPHYLAPCTRPALPQVASLPLPVHLSGPPRPACHLCVCT
jgi:hypothetical protein